jgi:hypothetical protein
VLALLHGGVRMSAGLTIRVDRFGQVRVVPQTLVQRFTISPDPDPEGVYVTTSLPPTPEGA